MYCYPGGGEDGRNARPYDFEPLTRTDIRHRGVANHKGSRIGGWDGERCVPISIEQGV